jgi:hypothetical protein
MPCKRGRAVVYDGGFIVAGPQCVPLEFKTRAHDPTLRKLSFGAGTCD